MSVMRRSAWALVGLLGACAGGRGVHSAPSTLELWIANRSGQVAVHELDAESADGLRFARLDLGEGVEFLAFHPQAPWVYVLCRETVEVLAYEDGGLVRRGGAPIPNSGTHLALDRTGRWLFVASYGNDSVHMFAIGADGVPGACVASLGGDGEGFCPNAHQIRVHPDNVAVYAPCLGADGVRVMPFDAERGVLLAGMLAPLPAGAGPRHMAFHPRLDVGYVWSELASTLSVVDIDPASGALVERRTHPAVPAGEPPSRSSDVQVTSDGRWLVGIHREPRNEMVGFELDERGDPSLAWRQPLEADHARTCSVIGDLVAVGATRGREVQLHRLVGVAPPLRLRRWSTPGEVMCVLLREGSEPGR